jgi:hypothetical protein
MPREGTELFFHWQAMMESVAGLEDRGPDDLTEEQFSSAVMAIQRYELARAACERPDATLN